MSGPSKAWEQTADGKWALETGAACLYVTQYGEDCFAAQVVVGGEGHGAGYFDSLESAQLAAESCARRLLEESLGVLNGG